jgi:hypothetical protein
MISAAECVQVGAGWGGFRVIAALDDEKMRLNGRSNAEKRVELVIDWISTAFLNVATGNDLHLTAARTEMAPRLKSGRRIIAASAREALTPARSGTFAINPFHANGLTFDFWSNDPLQAHSTHELLWRISFRAKVIVLK